jgi:hypothetical protein
MKIGLVTARSRSRSLVSALAGLALSFAAAGCGGGGGGSDGGGGGGSGGAGGTSGDAGTCGVAPCGGDVVGTWQASSACQERATSEMDFLGRVRGSCPSASLGDVTLTPSGMIAFGADMSFVGTLVVNAMIAVNIPPACTNNATCDAVAATMQSVVGTNGITSVSCAGTGSCTCTTMQTIDIVKANGMWATSGTELTFAGAPGGNGPICVQGSSLHMVALDRATMTRVINDIVLTKQ